MKEAKNVLRILKETQEAIKQNNASKIKNLSNQTINTASLTQDPDNILVAVIIYSLGKIFERENYREMKGWNVFQKTVISSLEKSTQTLEKNDEKGFRKNFQTIKDAINKLSGKLKKYIQQVFEKANISKASRIYEHGISMEQTAKLLGITMYDLADYAGKTGISDVPENKTLDAKSRIKLAMDIFG